MAKPDDDVRLSSVSLRMVVVVATRLQAALLVVAVDDARNQAIVVPFLRLGDGGAERRENAITRKEQMKMGKQYVKVHIKGKPMVRLLSECPVSLYEIVLSP